MQKLFLKVSKLTYVTVELKYHESNLQDGWMLNQVRWTQWRKSAFFKLHHPFHLHPLQEPLPCTVLRPSDPQLGEFKNFGSFFLNLYLLLKNSFVKQSIFNENQSAYGLNSLKLIKLNVT